jgi:LPS-assembly protein
MTVPMIFPIGRGAAVSLLTFLTLTVSPAAVQASALLTAYHTPGYKPEPFAARVKVPTVNFTKADVMKPGLLTGGGYSRRFEDAQVFPERTASLAPEMTPAPAVSEGFAGPAGDEQGGDEFYNPPNRREEADRLRVANAQSEQIKYEENAPVDLTADRLDHDDVRSEVTASGSVVLKQSGYTVSADRIVYSMKNDTVVASGNVVMTDPEGNVHFADTVRLSNKMRDGFISGLQVYLAGGGRLTAKEGTREGDSKIIRLKDAAYTPCECDEGKKPNPAWQIKAHEVTYDENKHRVSYKNARVEMFGVPVLYTPVLSHPDGKIKQKSGFLSPQFGYNSQLGLNVTENYYMGIAPDKDATIGVMAMSKAAPVAVGEYRQRFDNAELQLSGSATYSDRIDSINGVDTDTDDEFRGHLFADGEWDMNSKWRSGLKLELATDDQYLNQYDFTGKDVLENELYAERFSGRNYAVGRLLAFQDVRVREEKTDQPDVLPEIIASFLGEPNRTLGGRWSFDVFGLGLQRNGEGQDMARIVTEAGWERRFISDMGLVSTFNASVRGDAYQVNDRAGPAAFDNGGTETRLFPSATLVSSYPLVKPLEKAQAVIEPIASITVSSNVANQSDEIPNEDSQDVSIDASNLFEPDRFPGLDRVEDGSHATYGLRTGLYGYKGSYGTIFAGQSYRFDNDDNSFPGGSGLSTQRSDYVGQITASYRDRYGLDYRFQLDSDTLASRRHEADAFAEWSRLRLDMRYLYATALRGTEIDESREQAGIGAAYKLTKEWQVRTSAIEDLGEEPGLRRATFGIDYFGCCMNFSVTAQRNLTTDSSGDSGTDIMFRIGLKGLGDFQTQQEDARRRRTNHEWP